MLNESSSDSEIDDNLEILEELEDIITNEPVTDDEMDPTTRDSGGEDSSYVFSRSGEKWQKFPYPPTRRHNANIVTVRSGPTANVSTENI